MIQLTNGCSCTIPKVFPKNWADKNASTERDWYIYFTFHDPLFKDKYPEGKFVQIKKGVNYYKELNPRQEAVGIILNATTLKLKEKAFNPITNQFMKLDEIDLTHYEIHPDTPIFQALKLAMNRRVGLEDHTLADYKSMLKYVEISINELRFDYMPVKDVKRRHIKAIIDNCNKTPDRTNKYRSHLSALFGELIELETIETNPVENIRVLKTTKKIRQTLSKEQRKSINNYLIANHYAFWRYMQIFFHSGARSSELFKMKTQDVNLHRQTFKVIVKKRGQPEEVEKVIKDIAMPLWIDIMAKCKEDDYVFSFGFIPGQLKANTDRINKLWKKLIKDNDELGRPQADFYSLKHTHTTEVVEMLNNVMAAKHNSHTSTKMVDQVYDVRAEEWKAETVKELFNGFC